MGERERGGETEGEKERGMLHSVGRGVLYTSRTMGPSTLVQLSKTLSGRGANRVGSQLHGQKDADATLRDFRASQSPDVIYGIAAVPLVASCNSVQSLIKGLFHHFILRKKTHQNVFLGFAVHVLG